jgi:hypothetical protein
MTTTTILHTTVAREIYRIRQHLGYHDAQLRLPLEAHQLAEQLQRAVTELLEHSNQVHGVFDLN